MLIMDTTSYTTFSDVARFLKIFDVYSTSKLKLPENCFHFGNGLFAIVCLNDNNVNIHVCEFVTNANHELVPSENEIILTPFIWQALCDSLNNTDFVDLPSFFESFSLVRNELFLSIVERRNEMCISMQKCVLKPDFSRYFVPGVLLMSEYQWSRLKDMNHQITETVITFLFKHELKVWCMIATEQKKSMLTNFNVEKTDAEMTLTLSLAELLKIHLEKAMNIVFKCDGCLLNYANQLGHECITTTDEEKLNEYFNLSVTTFNLKEIACEFIEENKGLLKYITTEFFESLDLKYLIDFVRKLY